MSIYVTFFVIIIYFCKNQIMRQPMRDVAKYKNKNKRKCKSNI